MKYLVISAFLLVIPFATASEDPQLLENGSFDEFFASGVASRWSNNSWGDVNVRFSAEKVEAHNKLSQKIECLEFKNGAVQFVQGGVPLSKGVPYEIKIWMKGRVASPVEILLRKHGSPYTTYFVKAFKVTDKWRLYALTGTSVVDDPGAFFMIRFTSTGTLWVDDASLTDISNRRSVAPPLHGNLIANGSFEVGLDRWGVLSQADSYEYEMSVEMLNPKPVVVMDGGKIGRSLLKLTLPKHGRVLLTSPYVKVNSGRKYSLSLWAAADKPRNVSIGVGSGYIGQGARFSKEVELTREWKRYSISAILPSTREDAYYVLLETVGEGNIWLDGIQLEEGEVTPFAAHNPVEIGLKREEDTAFYDVGGHVKLGAVVSSYESGGAFSVSIKSLDYYGKKTDLWHEDMQLAANDRREIRFEHPVERPGYFKIIAEVQRDGKLLDSSEMAIGILPKHTLEPSIDSPFGNHSRFNEESFGTAKKLGVSWLRMHPPLGTKWYVVENRKGSFVFEDRSILLARSMGLNILGSLDGTPRWASTAPVEDGDSFSTYPPRDMKDWERYVYETVSHYKGIIDYWEVWNEPDSSGFLKISGLMPESRRADTYVNLLRIAYAAAKRANPNAVVVAGSSTGQPPRQWVEKIFAKGAYDYMDILSFHYYGDGRPGDAYDTPTSFYVNELKALVRKYGKGSEKPIWESESGIAYPETNYLNILEISPGYNSASQDAVAYVVRNHVHLIASGVSKWFYYSMVSSHRIDRNEDTGFFEWDGSPRPLAVAYANMSWVLGAAKYSHPLHLGAEINGEEFRDVGRIIDVIWAKEWSGDHKIPATIPTRESFPRYIVYDAMGNIVKMIANKKNINFVVGKEPIYVVFEK